MSKGEILEEHAVIPPVVISMGYMVWKGTRAWKCLRPRYEDKTSTLLL